MSINYKIPLFELNFNHSEEEAVVNTLRSRWISTGPKNVEFENKFAEMLGVNHAIALSNCTCALHLAMKVLDVKENDEVICPSLTFVATVNAIKYVGAVPVFCDIVDVNEPTMDPDYIRSLITKKTKVIVVMHYGGFPCRMDEIMKVCEEYNLKLIEDAAHSPLSEYKGKKVGTFGDVACFSFFSNKNVSTGEGGMLVTNDEEYYKKAKLLRSHGMTTLSYERSKGHSTEYDVVELGYNYRMDDLRASLGIVQLDKLKDDINKRIELKTHYVKYLNNIDEISIPFAQHSEYCSNYIFPIVLKKSDVLRRDSVRSRLSEKGIQTSIHYPAVHKFRIYNHDSIVLPKTEYYSANEITLPLYPNLSVDNVNYIINSLQSIVTEKELIQ